MGTDVVSEELHDEGGDAPVDADEDVDAGEDDVGRAGDGEEEGGRVHERRDGPAANTQTAGGGRTVFISAASFIETNN